MPVTFILGRAGTGKTRFCLDALLTELAKADESRRLLLLVPEQASFQMERTLAIRAPRHGYWRAEVLSFTRLARHAIEDGGHEPAVLRPSARVLALRCVAEHAKQTPEAFGASARTAGFFTQLDRLIEELLTENVSPEDMTQAAGRLEDAASRRRVATLARVYQDYLDWLGPDRIDPAQRLAELRERLAGLHWLREASVWVDGFAGFTGQELETLVVLARAAREVAITLLLDPASKSVRDTSRKPDLLDLFRTTETTYQRLVGRLGEEGVELRPPVLLQPSVVPRFSRSAGLARLEAGLATPIGAVSVLRRREDVGLGGPALRGGGDVGRGDPTLPASVQPAYGVAPAAGVSILECETHLDELRVAARSIRRRVAESNGELHFRDFAVIARDLDPFAHSIADVFAEYELPFFLDRRRPLGAHVLARFVGGLPDALRTDFSTEAMTRLLRCGLLPLSRLQAEALENTVVANEIRGFEIWRRARWRFERECSAPASDLERLDARRLRLVAALDPLVALAASDSSPAAATWARTLYGVLKALRVPGRVAAWIRQARREHDWETAELHRLAWDAVCEVLEDLHDVLGEHPLELPDLAAIVGSALSESTVGLAPPTLDQVLVSSIERSRHPDIKYAWVFGLNEGIFPAPPRDDTLLGTADRESLAAAGLTAPRPHRDDAFAERLLAYIALTRPSHGLTISYATIGDDGEPRFPSPLLGDVRQIEPALPIERAAEDEPPACLSEFARGYLGARAAEPRASSAWQRYERLCDELQASPRLAAPLARLLRGLAYENSPAAVPGYSRSTDMAAGVAWSGSPSELETYLQCPFEHFTERGLSLASQRGPQPLALELGQHAHAILAAVTDRAIAAPQAVGTLPDDQWLAFLRDATQEFEARRPADLAQRRPRVAFLSDALYSFLEDVVLAHAQRWRRGAFEPLACEQRFERTGEKGALRALELRTAGGKAVRLRGFIDRIDRCSHEGKTHLLVYDYKSSTRSVKTTYLTQDRLQLFAYLLAVEQAFETGEETQVAGVFLAPLYPDTTVLDRKYFAEASRAEARMYPYKPRGLFDAAIARLLDEQLGEQPSPVAAMQLKKDGDLYARSDAQAADELEARRDLARRTVLHAAEGIARGCIDVSPLLERRTLACVNCEFWPVCRFEPIFNRPRVAERSLPTLRTGSSAPSEGAA